MQTGRTDRLIDEKVVGFKDPGPFNVLAVELFGYSSLFRWGSAM